MPVTETLSKSVIMIRKVKPKEIPIMDTPTIIQNYNYLIIMMGNGI